MPTVFEHPEQPGTAPLTKPQEVLLRRIVATKGGGLSADNINHRVIAGLIERHMIQGKAGQPHKMVHTRLGLDWVRANKGCAK